MRDPAEVLDAYPLSPLQHGMLVEHLAGGRRAGIDVQQLDVTLRGAIDVPGLRRAWELIAARHPVLRTRFHWDGLDAPRQEIIAAVDVPVVEHDLSALGAANRRAAVDQYLAADRLRGFDLDTPPLWRVAVFTFGETRHRMVWSYAHAILDDSAADVLREVFDAYRAGATGAAARLVDRPRYGDCMVALQQDWLAHADGARAFWREQLRGVVKPTTLDNLQRAGAAGPMTVHHLQRFRLSSSTNAMLRRACAAHDVHPAAFIHAAWALVLGAFTSTDDIVFGERRWCRSAAVPGAEAIVGLSINTLPVRARVSAGRPLLALLRELDEARAAASRFDHTPLAEAAASADIPGGARLFDTLVILRDRKDPRVAAPGRPGQRPVLHERSIFSFTLTVALASGAFTLAFDRTRFDADLPRRMATLFTRLLHAMARRPDRTLGELPRLPAADQRALATFNRTAVEVLPPWCVHEAVEAQVDRTPDAVAVVCRGAALTYRELDERANHVAAELAARGIGPDRMVGVFVDRSIDLPVGLLGILKAGGAYLPLNPSYPPGRITMMLADSRPDVVLTTDRLRDLLPASAAEVVSLDSFRGERRPERIRASVAPCHLAYVIFTSGSTGRPKGVQVEHRNVINHFCGIDQLLGEAPGVWLAVAAISFDISVLELFWTLARGFTVVVQDASDPAEGGGPDRSVRAPGFFDLNLHTQVRRHGVTHLQCTPSMLERFVLEDGGLEALGRLRHLLVGGEALPAALVEQLRPHLTGTLHNMYGPTECTVWATAAVVTSSRSIAIGRPLANVVVHLRDRALQPVPVGVAGELLIGGAGVGRGYVARPDLTAERFITNAVTGERLYRTGDLAAWRADGQLVFMGRIDDQVKIRGHRIELEEIDHVISEHASVRDCVTVARSAPSGDVRLIAYVVAADEPAHALAAALHEYARLRLPPIMIPHAIVLVDAIPLTPNGKADRRALAASDAAGPGSASPPECHCTRAIVAVMQELVGRPVHADHNFFEVGAHSLILLRASARLSARLGRTVTLEEILRHPTARALATAITDADAAAACLDRAHLRQSALRRRSERGPRRWS